MLNPNHSVSDVVAGSLLVLEDSLLLYKILIWPT